LLGERNNSVSLVLFGQDDSWDDDDDQDVNQDVEDQDDEDQDNDQDNWNGCDRGGVCEGGGVCDRGGVCNRGGATRGGATRRAQEEEVPCERSKDQSIIQICEGVVQLDVSGDSLSSIPEGKCDQSVQVNLKECKIVNELKVENAALKQKVALYEEKKSLLTKSEEGFGWLIYSPKKFYFYTGLTQSEFDVLLCFLGPEAESLKMWGRGGVKMLPKFQLALTMIRLRQVSTHIDLSYRFKIGTKTVGNVFVTWIQFLYMKFDALRDKMFTPRSHHKPLPKSFQNSLLRNVRVVIDCTEFYIESSGDFKQQGNLYSSYKSRATAKVLIGVAPCGGAMFVSEVFEGSISDREIVKQSGFTSFLEKGDVVLADRGFTIEDLLAEKGATLVIPPFLGSRKMFTEQEMVRTKLIAKARIHVERFNERIKNNRILSGVIPHYLVPLLSQIVFVLCCLANFQEPLAK
jgi:hypothetical protein